MNESSPDPAGFPLKWWRLPADRPARIELLAIGAVLAVYVTLLLVWAARRDFVTYRQDFGETFVAYDQSEKLRETFPRYGMLHVQTSPAGKELVYTHNVNVGTYYFFLLRALGLESRITLTLAVLPIYVLSLLVAYLAVRAISGSRAGALLFLGLMLLDFANVGAFAFNALRAWHYLGLFPLFWGVYAIGNLPPGASRRGPLLALAAGAMISFGCGYDFFVIAGAAAGACLLLTGRRDRLWPALGWLGAACLLPFVLRQLEVIYWMGLHTWFTDFYLTFAIKVPFASRFIAIPAISEIDVIYVNAGLMRPPAYPTSDLAGIWNTLAPLSRWAMVPAYGVLGCLMTAAGVCAALVALVFARQSATYRLLALPAAYLLGAIAGLFIFAPFSLHVYVKHNFPLVAGLIHLAEAMAIVLAFQAGKKLLARGATAGAALALAGCVLLVGNAIAVQALNARHTKELDFRWIPRVKELAAGEPRLRQPLIAAVMMPPKSKGLIVDESDVTVLPPDRAPWILAAADGLLVPEPLFQPDASPAKAAALLYAPGDGWCNLDAREPDLSHRDWLLAMGETFLDWQPLAAKLRPVKPVIIEQPKGDINPQDIVHLKFWVPLPDEVRSPPCTPELRVSDADGRSFIFHNIINDAPRNVPTGAASLIYNAKFRLLDVFVRLPRAILGGAAGTLTMSGIIHFGPTIIASDPVTLNFSPDAPRVQITPVLPEPTTAQLRNAFPDHQVIEQSEKGVGYVVLDLKSRTAP